MATTVANTHDVASGEIRALSYNIHRAVGADGRHRPNRITGAIAEADGDIVGLQEVDWAADDDAPSSQHLNVFAAQNGYQVIKGRNLTDHRGHYGNMLLTRLPIARSERIELGVPGKEPRSAIDALLQTKTGLLRVIVTHFGLGWRERRYQAGVVARRLIATPPRPCLILGDLNEWVPFSPALRPLMRQCNYVSSLATYPARRPVLRLDRIMLVDYSGSIAVKVVQNRLARIASDHLPLLARLTMAPHGFGVTADADTAPSLQGDR